MPRLVVPQEVPGSNTQHTSAASTCISSPFPLLPACASWATCSSTQAGQAFSLAKMHQLHPPQGLPYPAQPESPTIIRRQNPSSFCCLFPRHLPPPRPLGHFYWGPLDPKTSQIWKMPRSPDSTVTKILRTFIQSLKCLWLLLGARNF